MGNRRKGSRHGRTRARFPVTEVCGGECTEVHMGKSLFIAEKPSVAQQFAQALGESMTRKDGYQESEHLVVTWCLGHLVTMSYPDVYDEKYKKWRLDTLPFIPKE